MSTAAPSPMLLAARFAANLQAELDRARILLGEDYDLTGLHREAQSVARCRVQRHGKSATYLDTFRRLVDEAAFQTSPAGATARQDTRASAVVERPGAAPSGSAPGQFPPDRSLPLIPPRGG